MWKSSSRNHTHAVSNRTGLRPRDLRLHKSIMALRLLKGGKSLFPKKEHPPKVSKVEHEFTEDEEVKDTH